MSSVRVLVALAGIAVLAACTSPQQQRIAREARMAERVLEREGSVGDPGRVAATDFSFAKMAREQGTWTAFREYAAGNAVMDAPSGFAPASEVLAGRADPAEPLRWAPTDIWSSCDGTLAVSRGRFQRANGLVGDYVTVWELQSNGDYKWIYDTGTPDDPQPAPRQEIEIPEDENVIVVEEMVSINGQVASCPAANATIPDGDYSYDGGVTGSDRASQDDTLSYSRQFSPDGSRRVVVGWWRDGNWAEVVDLAIPADAE